MKPRIRTAAPSTSLASAVAPVVAAHLHPVRALPVLAAGIIAAVHVGKLPPALPQIRDALLMDLVTAGFLVALFQLGSGLIGVFGGALADRFGPRRAQITGLLLLGAASLGGASAMSSHAALAWRAIESLGFIMSVLPGPSLIARIVAVRAMSRWLGLWGAYMPTGFALALLGTPWLLSAWGWRSSWIVTGLLALLCAASIRQWVPADPDSGGMRPVAIWPRVRSTLARPGPWLLSLCFVFYAGQFISIFAFLPTIYQEAGLSATRAGLLTALAVAANALGNVAAGRFLQRGVDPALLIAIAAVAMALFEWIGFGSSLGSDLRYAAIVLLSIVAGLIPGTLFACVPRFAPDAGAVSTTVGLVQQGAGIGQLLLPPVVAWVAVSTGGWQDTWIVTGVFAAIDLVLAGALFVYSRRRALAGA